MKGIQLILATAIISGFSIFLNKFGVGGFDAAVFATAKNILAAVFLLSLIALTAKRKELAALSRKQYAKLAAIGLVGGSLPFLLFFWGLQQTSAANAAFIHKTLFLWAGILAVFFLREKISRQQLFATAALFAGMLIFFGLPQNIGVAELAILAATLLWAGENIISKHVLKELSGTVVAWGRMFFGSLFLIAYLLATEKAVMLAAMSAEQFAWVGITSVLLFAYVFTYYNGLKTIPVSVATAVLMLGSVITSVLNAVFTGNPLPIIQLSGLLLMTASVALFAWPQRVVIPCASA